jgi:type I restriction enzyme M protein
VLQKCRLNAVIRLPDETFKPNKINVRSSVLYLTRLAEDDVDGELDYPIAFIDLRTLGYNGAGDPIRGFDLDRLVSDAAERWTIGGSPRSGEGWSAFDVNVSEVRSDPSHRFDLKYWEPTAKSKIAEMMAAGAPSISDINLIPTDRGRSPPAEAYVDAADGYAVVIKAGSNISKFGQITFEGADWIEKSIYDEFKAKAEIEGRNLNLVQDGDVLVSSTGDGTLGKCSVYRGTQPAVADGHVSIIRCDPSVVVPEYLADYLRAGFGAVQIARLYTGSTGLIELTKEALALVYVDLLSGTDEQRRMSEMLRQAEQRYRTDLENLQVDLSEAYSSFAGAPMPVASLPLAVDQEPNLNDE